MQFNKKGVQTEAAINMLPDVIERLDSSMAELEERVDGDKEIADELFARLAESLSLATDTISNLNKRIKDLEDRTDTQANSLNDLFRRIVALEESGSSSEKNAAVRKGICEMLEGGLVKLSSNLQHISDGPSLRAQITILDNLIPAVRLLE